MRVLIVEDEVKMAGLLRRGLREEGLAADVARTGDDAVWMARATEYDAIVLDVMLPGVDGFEVCRRLREAGTWSPVLMLTARDAVDDRVAGLDAGADDYLTKPFSFAELLARLRALARRPPVERPAVLEVGDLRLDPATRRVWRGDAEIALSAKEFALLETFMRRPGEVLSRYQLLEHCWDYGYENRSNVVDVYVRYLREKIDRPFGRDVARDGARRRLPPAMSRLPIRLRLTLAFALAMALVLAATGAFLYFRLQSSLDEAIDECDCEAARRPRLAADVQARPSPSGTRRIPQPTSASSEVPGSLTAGSSRRLRGASTVPLGTLERARATSAGRPDVGTSSSVPRSRTATRRWRDSSPSCC